MYNVVIRKSAVKTIRKMPPHIRRVVPLLMEDLREYRSPWQQWPHYSRIGKDRFHCHLAFQWVACWTCSEATMTIEVYYAGSREKAPY